MVEAQGIVGCGRLLCLKAVRLVLNLVQRQACGHAGRRPGCRPVSERKQVGTMKPSARMYMYSKSLCEICKFASLSVP